MRSLQGLLTDLDEKRERDRHAGTYFRPRDITGVYDDATEQRVRTYQPLRDISPDEYGRVLPPTWDALLDDAWKLTTSECAGGGPGSTRGAATCR